MISGFLVHLMAHQHYKSDTRKKEEEETIVNDYEMNRCAARSSSTKQHLTVCIEEDVPYDSTRVTFVVVVVDFVSVCLLFRSKWFLKCRPQI